MKNLSRTVLIFILIFCSCITAFSADDKYVILDVEGEGANRNEAIEAAWLEGIRQAAGSFIDSKTELNDDKLTERIISYSRGLVERYDVLSVDDSRADEGIYKLKLRMWIVSDILRDGTRHATANSAEISFSASDLKKTKEDEINAANANALEKRDASAETAKKRSQSAAELLEAMLDRYNPEDFLSCYIPNKPEAVKGKSDVFNLNVELNFNEKLYKEAFIPDLIQVLDQIASVKKNTLLLKNKDELRDLNNEKNALKSWNNSSIVLKANELGKDYYLAVYNKPENLGCRLYNFAQTDANNILNYKNGTFAKFFERTQRVKGLLIELLDEDGETIETFEKKFDIAFLITNGNKTQNIWSIQPTIMVHYPEENDKGFIPDGITVSQKGIISDPDDLTIIVSFYNNDYNLHLGYSNSVIDEKSEYFPFAISPQVSSKGQWSKSDGRNRGDYTFSVKPTSLKMNTLYKVKTQNEFLKKLLGDAIGPSAGEIIERNKKEFSFQTTTGWEEKMQLIIPVELEMPEEILPYVKKIRASLLLINLDELKAKQQEKEMRKQKEEEMKKLAIKQEQASILGFYAEPITPELREKYKILTDTQGLIITYVLPGHNRYDAELKEGDILLDINGRTISNFSRQSIREAIAMDSILILMIERNGSILAVSNY